MITDTKIKMLQATFLFLFTFFFAAAIYAQDLRKIEEDFLKGEFSGSEVYCVDPRSAREQTRVYYLAGLNYMNLGSPSIARDFFRKAFKESKDANIRESASIKIGDTFLQEDNYPQALEVYEYFLKEFPRSVKKDEVRYKAALTCSRAGDWSREREYIRQAKQSISSTSLLYDRLIQLANQGYFFTVQAGVFINKNNALALMNKLKAKGYKTSLVEDNSDRQPLYKVICGKYSTRTKALLQANALSESGYSAIVYP